jgi:hypothetical protein
VKKIYPEKVLNAGKRIHQYFIDDGEMYQNYNDAELLMANEVILEDLLTKYLNDKFGDDLPSFTHDDLTTLMQKILSSISLSRLHNEGIVDYYIDDDGEEIYFLTELGKKIGQTLSTEDNQN